MQDSIPPHNYNGSGAAFWVRHSSNQPDALNQQFKNYQDYQKVQNESAKHFNTEVSNMGFEGTPLPKSKAYNIELSGLVILLLLLSLSKYLNPKRMLAVLMAPIHFNRPDNVLKEGGIYNERIGFPLVLNHLFCNTLLLSFLFSYWVGSHSFVFDGVEKLLGVFIGLGIWYLLKFIFVSISGLLFDAKSLIKSYLSIFTVSASIQGLYLLPIVMGYLVIGHPVFIYFAVVWTIITFIYRLIRFFIQARQEYGFSIYHNILYLCTLEILPIGLLIKALLEIH